MPGQGLHGPRVECDAARVAELFAGGRSVNSIAMEMRVSTGTVERRLASRGLKPRSRAEENRKQLAARTPEQRKAYAVAAVKASVKSRRGKVVVYGVRVSVMMSRAMLAEIDSSRGAEYRQDWIREAISRRLRSHRQNAGKRSGDNHG